MWPVPGAQPGEERSWADLFAFGKIHGRSFPWPSELDVAWSAACVMGVRIHFIETHVSQQFPPGVAAQRKRGGWEGSACLGRKTEWKRADNHQPMQLNCHIQRYPPADTFPRQDSDSVLKMQSMSRANPPPCAAVLAATGARSSHRSVNLRESLDHARIECAEVAGELTSDPTNLQGVSQVLEARGKNTTHKLKVKST